MTEIEPFFGTLAGYFGLPMVFGGDFNQIATEGRVPWWLNHPIGDTGAQVWASEPDRWDGVWKPTSSTHGTLNRHIDYLWFSNWSWNGDTSVYLPWNASEPASLTGKPASDHKLYLGKFG